MQLRAPLAVETVPVITAREMYDAVDARFDGQDIVVMAAAVADYRPAQEAAEKIKKTEAASVLELERTDDILGSMSARKNGQLLCGFSMETENLLENSRAKLRKKNLDMIVANNLRTQGAGFGTDTNVITLITPDGAQELPLMSKDEAARAVFDKILQIMQNR